MIGAEVTGSPRVQINWVRIEPGGRADTHVHPMQDHGYFVIDGKLRVTADEADFTVGPETAVYLPAGVRHSLEAVGGEPVRMIGFFAPSR